MKVININSNKAHIILKKCGILREYSLFVDKVREHSIEEDSIKRAINECIRQGILSDYLKRKGSEVTNMLIAEYSYKEDIQESSRRRCRKAGRRAGERVWFSLHRYSGLTMQS